MSSSHIRLCFSTARAKRMASGTVQPGPQSSASPIPSPSASFIAATQSSTWPSPRSVKSPRSVQAWKALGTISP